MHRHICMRITYLHLYTCEHIHIPVPADVHIRTQNTSIHITIRTYVDTHAIFRLSWHLVNGKADTFSSVPSLHGLFYAPLETAVTLVWLDIDPPDLGGRNTRRFLSPPFFPSRFCSILGCVRLLQEVAIHQSPPTFSVLCYPCP